MARTDRLKAARWLDRLCRVVFPATLAIIAVYAFVWHRVKAAFSGPRFRVMGLGFAITP